MEVIWRRGSATVAEVAEEVEGEGGSAYTTILTMMRIMSDKGYLTSHKEGRAHIFTPAVERDVAARSAVKHVLSKFFSGSPSELVLSFLKDENFDVKELEEIKQQIRDSAKRKAKK